MTQLSLPLDEVSTRRGRELAALKDIRLGDATLKLVLRVLDDHINHQSGYWDLTTTDLAEACELSKTTLLAKLKRLQELGLVSITDLRNTNRKRFRIGRATLDEMAAECRRSRPDRTISEIKPVPRAAVAVQKLDDSVQNLEGTVQKLDDSVQNLEGTVQNSNGAVQISDRTILPLSDRPDTEINRPRTDRRKAAAELVELLKDNGVEMPGLCIKAATAAGATIGELVQLVQHFETINVDAGYGPEALYWRVSNHVPGMSVSDGWPPSKRSKADPVALDDVGAEQFEAYNETEIAAAVSRVPVLATQLAICGTVPRLLSDPARRKQVWKCLQQK